MIESKVETIEKDLYRIKVPLPGLSLGSVNSYVVLSDERCLIVDTGLNSKKCREAVLGGLQEIGADLQKADYFITHMHSDHVGLVRNLAGESSRVYLNTVELEMLRNLKKLMGLSSLGDFVVRYGFPRERVDSAINQFPGRAHSELDANEELQFEPVRDGDTIRCGSYRFLCVQTPGHSPGHTCLFEPDKKILFSGDHILGTISPSIQCMAENTNPLKSYLESLEKVQKLGAKMILPGHRSVIKAPEARIQELLAHHGTRNREILDALKKGRMSAYELARHITWNLPYETWNDIPDSQKWFATGETIAHLRFLEEEKQVARHEENDFVFFEVTQR